jgi:hypothetical protein
MTLDVRNGLPDALVAYWREEFAQAATEQTLRMLDLPQDDPSELGSALLDSRGGPHCYLPIIAALRFSTTLSLHSLTKLHRGKVVNSRLP